MFNGLVNFRNCDVILAPPVIMLQRKRKKIPHSIREEEIRITRKGNGTDISTVLKLCKTHQIKNIVKQKEIRK